MFSSVTTLAVCVSRETSYELTPTGISVYDMLITTNAVFITIELLQYPLNRA